MGLQQVNGFVYICVCVYVLVNECRATCVSVFVLASLFFFQEQPISGLVCICEWKFGFKTFCFHFTKTNKRASNDVIPF